MPVSECGNKMSVRRIKKEDGYEMSSGSSITFAYRGSYLAVTNVFAYSCCHFAHYKVHTYIL